MRRTLTSALLGLALVGSTAAPALAQPSALQFRIISIHTDHVKVGVSCPTDTENLHVRVSVWQENSGGLTVEEGTVDISCSDEGLQVLDVPIADEWSGENLVKGVADVVEIFIWDDEDLFVDLGNDPIKIKK